MIIVILKQKFLFERLQNFRIISKVEVINIAKYIDVSVALAQIKVIVIEN